MTLSVAPLEASDFDQLIRHADVFDIGDDVVAPPNPVAWPIKTRTEAQVRARHCFAWQKRRFLEDPTVNFLKVVDEDDDNAIVAVARWHYYPKGYSYEKEAHWEMAPQNSTTQDAYPPINFNLGLHNHILTERDSFREAWLPAAQPCWILMHLVTRVSQRKRGAAALLIRWGLQQAEQTRAPAYLEAGAAGRPVYGRFGFCQVGPLRKVDLRPHGLDADFELANMVFRPGESPPANLNPGPTSSSH